MTFRITRSVVKKQNLYSSTVEVCSSCGGIMSLEPDIRTGYVRICPQCGRRRKHLPPRNSAKSFAMSLNHEDKLLRKCKMEKY